MSDSLEPRDDLTERLAALGRQPVAPALQSSHLTAMASVRAERSFRTSLVGRLKVGAGVMAGFLLGASGLASVGGLGPLQPIVADRAAEVANVELPQGPKDKAEKAAAKAAKASKAKAKGAGPQGEGATNKIWGGPDCPEEGLYRNRGTFLKAAKDAEFAEGDTVKKSFADARASDCGKGADAAGEDGEVKEEKPEADEVEGAENGKADEANGKKDAAPGLEDKGEPGEKAKGPKDGEGTDNKPETPAGPPAEGEAGNTDLTPPVNGDTPAEPNPETPAPAAGDNPNDEA